MLRRAKSGFFPAKKKQGDAAPTPAALPADDERERKKSDFLLPF